MKFRLSLVSGYLVLINLLRYFLRVLLGATVRKREHLFKRLHFAGGGPSLLERCAKFPAGGRSRYSLVALVRG